MGTVGGAAGGVAAGDLAGAGLTGVLDGAGLGLGGDAAGRPLLQFWLPAQGEQLPWPLQTCRRGGRCTCRVVTSL